MALHVCTDFRIILNLASGEKRTGVSPSDGVGGTLPNDCLKEESAMVNKKKADDAQGGFEPKGKNAKQSPKPVKERSGSRASRGRGVKQSPRSRPRHSKADKAKAWRGEYYIPDYSIQRAARGLLMNVRQVTFFAYLNGRVCSSRSCRRSGSREHLRR